MENGLVFCQKVVCVVVVNINKIDVKYEQFLGVNLNVLSRKRKNIVFFP